MRVKIKKSKESKSVLIPSTRLSFETSYSYWLEIRKNLEFAQDVIEKEVKRLAELMPDSESYWTMNSRLDDAKSIVKEVGEFLEPHLTQDLDRVWGREDEGG